MAPSETNDVGVDLPATDSGHDPWAVEHLPYMRLKLEGVGATPGEIDEFTAQWLDVDWPRHEKETIMALGDAKLREAMLTTRKENLVDVESEDDEQARLHAEGETDRLTAVQAKAQEMSALDPVEVLEWAGEDRERLQASLDVEQAHPEPRAELVEALESALG